MKLPGLIWALVIASSLFTNLRVGADEAKPEFEGNRAKMRANMNPVKELTKLAENGSKQAQMELGSLYYKGDVGMPPDIVQAIYWFEQAAAQGVAQAKFNLALIFQSGEGVEMDIERAVSYYKEAAEQGLIEAQVNLALLLREEGKHGEAAELFREAAKRGNISSMREFGRYLLSGLHGVRDVQLALKYLATAAESGDTESQLMLADCYGGLIPGVEPNPELLKDYLWQAVTNDSVEAMAKIGYCYEHGRGVQRDTPTAVIWYRKAARRGHTQAMVNLGYCYMFGRGVAMDKKAAFSWYEKAATLDFPLGTYNLGVCYANGQGVATDEKIAFDYFLEAANGGSANARHDLVRCYRDGIGTPPDAVQAQIWTDKIFSDLPEQPDWEGKGVLGLPPE